MTSWPFNHRIHSNQLVKHKVALGVHKHVNILHDVILGFRTQTQGLEVTKAKSESDTKPSRGPRVKRGVICGTGSRGLRVGDGDGPKGVVGQDPLTCSRMTKGRVTKDGQKVSSIIAGNEEGHPSSMHGDSSKQSVPDIGHYFIQIQVFN